MPSILTSESKYYILLHILTGGIKIESILYGRDAHMIKQNIMS